MMSFGIFLILLALLFVSLVLYPLLPKFTKKINSPASKSSRHFPAENKDLDMFRYGVPWLTGYAKMTIHTRYPRENGYSNFQEARRILIASSRIK